MLDIMGHGTITIALYKLFDFRIPFGHITNSFSCQRIDITDMHDDCQQYAKRTADVLAW